MAKLSSIEKNKNRGELVRKAASRRARLKAITDDRALPIEERMEATRKLAEMPRNTAKIRLRNRCAMTGRARAYYRKFGVSRIMLRQLASFGKLPGVTKSSW